MMLAMYRVLTAVTFSMMVIYCNLYNYINIINIPVSTSQKIDSQKSICCLEALKCIECKILEDHYRCSNYTEFLDCSKV